MNKNSVFSACLILITGCAGMNPNPGERTTDLAWTSNNFEYAYDVAKPRANAGEPWAQLRLGIFYQNGWGVEKDLARAEYWYKKAVAQKDEGNWAEGKMIGAAGKLGYFNQNSDARIAEYNLAQLYYSEDKNLKQALEHINNVIIESNGKAVFFCCKDQGGRYFTQEQFVDLKQKIEEKLNRKK